MGYLQDVDKWLGEVLPDIPEANAIKREIKAKILESYRNGQAAGKTPAPPRSNQRPSPKRYGR